MIGFMWRQPLIYERKNVTQFICIEGGEGVGKSSLISGLQNHLQSCGKDVVVTRQPGGTDLSERIREVFLEDLDLHAYSELNLLLADRAHHLKLVVKPALDEGKVVICDRYHMSSFVYQGKLGGLPSEQITKMIEAMYESLSMSNGSDYYPDLYLLLDCPVEVSEQRLKKRSIENHEITRFDAKNKSFHEQLRSAYLEVSKQMPSVKTIDASKHQQAVLQDAISILSASL